MDGNPRDHSKTRGTDPRSCRNERSCSVLPKGVMGRSKQVHPAACNATGLCEKQASRPSRHRVLAMLPTGLENEQTVPTLQGKKTIEGFQCRHRNSLYIAVVGQSVGRCREIYPHRHRTPAASGVTHAADGTVQSRTTSLIITGNGEAPAYPHRTAGRQIIVMYSP